jgi:Ribbon-helix-helix protein, copG family
MASASERLVVQLTAKEKREIRRRAREAGLNVSEFVRRAATGVADMDDELLGLLDRAERAAKEGIALIDDALDFVKASNVRIARMEAEAKSS